MYKFIFLAMLVFNFCFKLALQMLQNKQVGKPLPASVADIYNEEEYSRWRRYNNKKDRLHLVSMFLSLFVNIALYCTDLISVIYYALPGGEIVKSLIFFVLMGVVDALVSLPIDYIFNFKIEAEFGFNKATPKTFISDMVKIFWSARCSIS